MIINKAIILLSTITITNTQKIDSDFEFSQFGFKKENSLECPLISATCNKGDYDYYPNQFSAPQCWMKLSNNKYDCHYLDDLGLIECPKCYTNVNFCGYPIFSKNQTGSTIPIIKEKEKEPQKEKDNKVDNINLITKPTKCPTKESSCRYDTNTQIQFTNSMVPKCWGLYENEYVCIKKVNKLCPDGYLDISSCIDGKPPIEKEETVANKCPTTEDICYFNGEIPVSIATKNTPKCWKKTKTGYLCETGDKGKCSNGYLNIMKCLGYVSGGGSETHAELKVPEYCPPLSSSCAYNNFNNFKLNDKSPPECWLKTSNGGYACKYKRELNGICPLGTVDTTPCRPGVITDADTKIKCPKSNIKCLYQQKHLFDLNDKSSPECWAKTPNGYVCRYKNELGGICPLNVLDISMCNNDNNNVDINCPNTNDQCNFNNIGLFNAMNPIAPECWIKTKNTFYCRYKKDFNNQCPTGSSDIDSCPIRQFKNNCPKVDDTCNYKDQLFKFSDFSIPECWAKVGKNYECRHKEEFNGVCPNLSIDVSQCDIPLTCPNYNDKCKTSLGMKFDFKNDLAPSCWKRGKNNYECKGKGFRQKECDKEYLDINTCNRDKPPPPCPKVTDQCSYTNEIKYPPSDLHAPGCWTLNRNNQYTCKFNFEFKDNLCPSNYLDIKKSCRLNPIENNPNKMKCPIAGSRCLYDQNGFILLNTPHSPECWLNTPNGYVCKYKSELPNFQCAINSIDVTNCIPNEGFIEENNLFNPYKKSY